MEITRITPKVEDKQPKYARDEDGDEILLLPLEDWSTGSFAVVWVDDTTMITECNEVKIFNNENELRAFWENKFQSDILEILPIKLKGEI